MLSTDPAEMAVEIRAAEDHAAKHHAPIRRMVEQFATRWYRDDLTAEPTPANRVFSWIAWMMPQLAYAAPAALVEANWQKSHGPLATWMEAGAKRWSGCYPGIAEQFALWVRDALFAFGVLKIGLDDVNGEIRPYLRHIPMDAWGCDPRRNDHLSEGKFQYHRYDVDFDDLLNMRGLDPAAILKIKDTYDSNGDRPGTGLIGGKTGNRKGARVYDIWLPETQSIGTLLSSGNKDPLDVWLRPPRPFWGPKTGPFVVLGFKSVPGDTYPCSDLQPVMQQIQAINAHLRAAAKEADSFKTGIAVDSTMPDAAKGIEQGEANGIWILPGIAGRPNGVQTLTLGGFHPQRLEHIDRMGQALDRDMAMGDAQLGISNSDTATANNIADQASNIRIKGMQGIVNAKAAEALAGVMWWLFYDPSIEQKVSFTSPTTDPATGQEQTITQEATMRGGVEAHWYRGEFFPPQTDISWPEDFTVTVDPESTTHTSNQARLGDAMMILQQVVPVAAQMLQNPGIDVEWIVNNIGNAMNRRNLFKSIVSPQLAAQARTGQLMMPIALPAGASPAMAAGIAGQGGGVGLPQPASPPQAPTPAGSPVGAPPPAFARPAGFGGGAATRTSPGFGAGG